MTQSEYLEDSTTHRRTIVRNAILYGPFALVGAGLFLHSLSGLLAGSVGALFPAVIIGILTTAFGVEALGALRDLRAEPITTTGKVRRTWSRGGLFWFFRSHYMYVDKHVFTVHPLTSMSIQAGDTVEVVHWPHTKTVIRVRLLEQAPSASQRFQPEPPSGSPR
jgi:hypothetical protein